MVTKEELRREIRDLRRVGSQMSNICFNLGQRYRKEIGPMEENGSLRNYDCLSMSECRAEWDAIERSEKS